MNKVTKTKAMQGIRTFLERRGFEIIEDGWGKGKSRVDFIAREDDDLVFVNCNIYDDEGNGFPADKPDRVSCEMAASKYLGQAGDLEQSMIRFDIVSMLVLGESRAMLRHYRNALSAV
ncbi:MAG: endonuclease [Eggerthellaceae bacterium]|nr:endonuclease [Eggerthellaceae bacterium]